MRGPVSLEQAKCLAIIDQINAHVQELVNLHGSGVLRPHRWRNDSYAVLTCDELEFVEHLTATYRPTGDD